MADKRKKHSAEFKAQVALEAIKGAKTLQQLAEEFELHPVQISTWKKRLTTQAARLFENGKQQAREEDFATERRHLHSKIGELTIKLDLALSTSHQHGSTAWMARQKPTRPKPRHSLTR